MQCSDFLFFGRKYYQIDRMCNQQFLLLVQNLGKILVRNGFMEKLTLEICREYQEKAKRTNSNNGADIDARRQLREELQNRCGTSCYINVSPDLLLAIRKISGLGR